MLGYVVLSKCNKWINLNNILINDIYLYNYNNSYQLLNNLLPSLQLFNIFIKNNNVVLIIYTCYLKIFQKKIKYRFKNKIKLKKILNREINGKL